MPDTWRSSSRLLFVRRLRVPVVITDLDQARVDKGVAHIHDEIDDLLAEGPHLARDEANRLKALVTGTTDKADFADCDWVIEAVFEELGVKQTCSPRSRSSSPKPCLATNTSSLSVEQIGAKLKHPERLVGFHFFNPVAVMPLIEVVKTPKRPTMRRCRPPWSREEPEQERRDHRRHAGLRRQPPAREAPGRGDARASTRAPRSRSSTRPSRRSGCR